MPLLFNYNLSFVNLMSATSWGCTLPGNDFSIGCFGCEGDSEDGVRARRALVHGGLSHLTTSGALE